MRPLTADRLVGALATVARVDDQRFRARAAIVVENRAGWRPVSPIAKSSTPGPMASMMPAASDADTRREAREAEGVIVLHSGPCRPSSGRKASTRNRTSPLPGSFQRLILEA